MARCTPFKNRRDDAAIASVRAAYVKRDLPFFDPLNSDVVAGLEAQVDWLLQEVGIAFRDDLKPLEIWRKAGVKPEGDLIKVPADWIRALCCRAPSEFTQRARNPERSMRIGGASGGERSHSYLLRILRGHYRCAFYLIWCYVARLHGGFNRSGDGGGDDLLCL